MRPCISVVQVLITYGRFRWVELELKLFLSPKYRKKYWKDVASSLDDLESHVGKGVPQLNKTYGTIYRMNTEDQPHAQALARRVLKWVLLPLFPFGNPVQRQDASDMVKLDAVVEAISTDTDGSRDLDIDENFIANICSNLVIFDESTKAFRFAHLSVVEYLQNRVTQDTGPPDEEFSFIHVSAEVAISCLSWIAHSAKNGGSRLSRSPSPLRPSIERNLTTVGDVPTLATLHISLLRFSVLYWPFYYLHTFYNGGKEEALRELFKKVMLENRGSKEFKFWIDRYKQSSGASHSQLQDDRLMRPWSNNRTSGETWHTPRLSAGLLLDTKFITRHPVNPGALYSASGSPSKAFAAAIFGLESVITGATDAEIAEKNLFKQTNLQIAAARGHDGVVKALLKRIPVLKDINLSSRKDDTFWDLEDPSEHEFWSHGTALHFAFLSNKGSTEVIEALIRAGADVEARNSQNQTPRDMAVRAGRENDLKVLDDYAARKEPLIPPLESCYKPK
jgi:hypothetical protein